MHTFIKGKLITQVRDGEHCHILVWQQRRDGPLGWRAECESAAWEQLELRVGKPEESSDYILHAQTLPF